jgi:MFS family permease
VHLLRERIASPSSLSEAEQSHISGKHTTKIFTQLHAANLKRAFFARWQDRCNQARSFGMQTGLAAALPLIWTRDNPSTQDDCYSARATVKRQWQEPRREKSQDDSLWCEHGNSARVTGIRGQNMGLKGVSPLEPFRNRAFLNYWLAGLSANFGWQIQLVAASWLMIAMGGTPAQVAMVQMSVALPVMLMSLPGGALADLVGQRALIIWAQGFLVVVSVLLAALAWLDLLTPRLLLVMTFLIGSGRALYYPGWQSLVLEFFPRDEARAAMSVNSSNLNIARSLGPAIGGAIVATAGAFLAFVANALSNLSVIIVAFGWPKPNRTRGLPPEPFGSAIIAGLRYMLMSPKLISITLRATLFNVAAIATLALMPLIARDQLGGGPQTYGVLLGAYGIGGVVGALAADSVRQRLTLEAFLSISHLLFAAGTALIVVSPSFYPSVIGGIFAGVGWSFVQVTLNTAVQLSSPRWVVGRSIAIYQTCIFGGNALGSFVWGQAANSYGPAAALAVPVILILLGAVLGVVMPIREVAEREMDALPGWTAPQPLVDMILTSGPILTTVTYRIREEDVPIFLEVMRTKRQNRLRDGAARWTLSRDILDPTLWFERFKVATWAEAQRLHSRRTVAGAQTIETLRSLHQGSDRPEVRYELVRHPGMHFPKTNPGSVRGIDQ